MSNYKLIDLSDINVGETGITEFSEKILLRELSEDELEEVTGAGINLSCPTNVYCPGYS